jgi:regulatory protein
MLTIQKIEIVKRNPSKLRLVFEDSSYVVSVDTVASFSLYEGKEVSEEELNEIVSHGLFSDLQERVIGYITYSPRTELQVRQYIQKYFRKINLDIDTEDMVEELVEKMKEYKYIDDRAYAELFVKSRLENKPKSRFVLSGELASKGISRELADEILNKFLPDDVELLKKVYTKKYGDEPLTLDEKKKISFLQRKDSVGMIFQIL